MRRLIMQWMLLILALLPLTARAGGTPDLWVNGMVHCITGQIQSPLPLPSTASDLRRKLGHVERLDLFTTLTKEPDGSLTVGELDGTRRHYIPVSDEPMRWELTDDTWVMNYAAGQLVSGSEKQGRRIDYDGDTETYRLATGQRTARYYYRERLIREEHADGSKTCYEYDKQGRLSEAQIYHERVEIGNLDRAKAPRLAARGIASMSGEALSWLKWSYDSGCSVTGSDGLTVDYTVDDQGNLLTLTPVSGMTSHYTYSEGRLVRYDQADGYFVCFDYAPQTIQISAPAGTDETPVVIASIRFSGSFTEVVDARGARTRYVHQDGRLVAKEEYGTDDTLYRSERFWWSKQGLLTASARTDASGQAVWSRSFDYDDADNLVSETLYGNLTGAGCASFSVDERGRPVQDIESFSRYYHYDELGRVVEARNGNGIVTHFTYLDDTSLVCTKSISDDRGIHLRISNSYNDIGQVTAMAMDDGVSDDFSDITHVTRRHSVSIAYVGARPALKDEKYFDPQTQKEIIQKTTLHLYDSNGRVIEKQLINGAGACVDVTNYRYDRLGRMMSTASTDGVIKQYQRDALGRIVKARDSDKKTSIASIYDLSGRLIGSDVTDAKQRSFHQSKRYDLLGHCIAEIDIYGNETLHSYDLWGRCICTIYPPDSQGVQATITRSHDLCDRVVKTVDPSGYVTEMRYNIRGCPTRILYPDGTREVFEYNLDGSLRRFVARDGVVTALERDYLSRIVQKTLSGKSGIECFQKAAYDAFDQTSMVDALGRSVRYKHDAAGRLTETTIEWDGGSACSDYTYDEQDLLISSKQWFGDDIADFAQAKVERSSKGQPLSYQLLDSNERSLVSEDYLHPNLTPKDDANHVEEDFTYRNSMGQRVLKRQVTDSSGTTEVVIHDALGRICHVGIKDRFGVPLSTTEMRYDRSGNLIEERQITLQGPSEITRYTYGPVGRLEAIVEHCGAHNEASAYYEYNDKGQLSRMVKPDGVCLDLHYDDFGRVQRLWSSDRTVDYLYRYDLGHRPVEVIDQLTNSAVTRSYHPLGGIKTENLGDERSISKAYDRLGRLCQLTLPDGSGISYTYDAVRLLAVHRLGSAGNTLYSHTYDRFSDDGRPTKATQIEDAGTVTYGWDSEGRLAQITSKWWSQRIDERDAKGNVLKARVWDLHGRHTTGYAYDALSQVTSENGVVDRDYSYDRFGNRLDGDAAHITDVNGNVIIRVVDGVRQRLRYDALNRLIEVKTTDGQGVTFTYDAFNRRLSKTVVDSQGSKETVYFLYDDDKEVACVNERGDLLQLRLLGIGIHTDVGATVALEIDGKPYATMCDSRGSVACLIDQNGRPVECYRFTAYGQETLYDPSGQQMPAGSALNPYRFAGKRIDEEAGLIYFGRRYYDPAAGRWLTPDPIGKADGSNRHAFVHNNPVTRVDPQGLYSVPDLWGTAVTSGFGYLRQLGSYMRSVADFLQQDFSLIDDILDDLRLVAQEVFGPTLFMLAGLQGESVDQGVFGDGEVSDTIRLTFINGVLNDRESVLSAARLISQTHGGENVHYIFRPTAGWTGDIFNGVLTLVGYTSPSARKLAEGWRELIKEVGGVGRGGMILHYAHSLGGVETFRASQLMTEDELKMIRVITFGSAKVLTDERFHSVHNYVSWLDPVMIFDAPGYFNSADLAGTNLTFLTHSGIFLIENHKFRGAIYRKIIEELGRSFVQLFDPNQGYATAM